jgi:hypothetical protein
MSQFRPAGRAFPQSHLGYSPYVVPTVVNDIKTVILDERLRALEPRAYEFVIAFARDNDLLTVEPSDLAKNAEI